MKTLREILDDKRTAEAKAQEMEDAILAVVKKFESETGFKVESLEFYRPYGAILDVHAKLWRRRV